MPSPVDKVMQFVERELAKNPTISNEALFEGAKKINRAVAKLSPRQFHAKYPLQVKRRNGSARKAKKGKRRARAKASARPRATRRAPAAREGNAEGVRRVLMRFAKDLTEADSQAETIDVLARLDRYVADIMKAARR